jgi:hypothetical protein
LTPLNKVPVEDFAERMDVCCPMCHRRACVMRIPADEKELLPGGGSPRFHRTFSARKFSCLHCGSTCFWQGNVQRRGGPYDWYFRFPLWLQTSCCGEILWAFNEDHVRFLEQYVLAKQRIKFHEEGRVRNGTLASRLPIWIKRAKNREEVTKGILRLKKLQCAVFVNSR